MLTPKKGGRLEWQASLILVEWQRKKMVWTQWQWQWQGGCTELSPEPDISKTFSYLRSFTRFKDHYSRHIDKVCVGQFILLPTRGCDLHDLPSEQNGRCITPLSFDRTPEHNVFSDSFLRVTRTTEAKQPIGIVALQHWRKNNSFNKFENGSQMFNFILPLLMPISRSLNPFVLRCLWAWVGFRGFGCYRLSYYSYYNWPLYTYTETHMQNKCVFTSECDV